VIKKRLKVLNAYLRRLRFAENYIEIKHYACFRENGNRTTTGSVMLFFQTGES
jgi:hypothetical protein